MRLSLRPEKQIIDRMNLAIKVDNQDKEQKNKINGLGIMKEGKY